MPFHPVDVSDFFYNHRAIQLTGPHDGQELQLRFWVLDGELAWMRQSIEQSTARTAASTAATSMEGHTPLVSLCPGKTLTTQEEEGAGEVSRGLAASVSRLWLCHFRFGALGTVSSYNKIIFGPGLMMGNMT
ncbi:unnamed protein product [Cuscuta epithymum]|uniref:Uncharacterized protein n=1 Tax=Cuscuta epithymum TaxID=186058 RepID=A0AAV0D190_9ASTE|nr:unnamed protein product [Cuscuta epithymum]